MQREQVAGDVVVGDERFGGDHLIAVGDAQQPFIKGPMTELAEGETIARIVVVAD